MKQIFRKYFTFRKNDRVGIIVLLSLILIIFLLNITVSKFIKNKKEFDFTQFSAEIDTFLVSLTPKETTYMSKLDSAIVARYDTLDLFLFNPNKTTSEQWKQLGLTDKQINTINTYKERGGTFAIKDDFRKIYGIRTKQYEILKPYILLPDEIKGNSKTSNEKQEEKSYILFEFDPNTATNEQFIQLGLSEKQVSTILKYRNSGGKFYKKEDFKKIYVISEKDYLRLESYIVINQTNNKVTETENNTEIVENKTEKKVIKTVEINSADTSLFNQLPGIGPVIADRIIKYRDKLGGFVNTNQISEVYGIKPEVFSNLKQYLTISVVTVKTININLADFSELTKHPYIDKTIANSIISSRKKNGFFSSVNELLSREILDKLTFDKLQPYLRVE